MMEQLDIEEEIARARRGDPATSKAAAATVGPLSEGQRAVRTVLRTLGREVTDEELVDTYTQVYRALVLPRQSASGIRSRRVELARRGEVVQGEDQLLSTGRYGRSWRLPEERR